MKQNESAHRSTGNREATEGGSGVLVDDGVIDQRRRKATASQTPRYAGESEGGGRPAIVCSYKTIRMRQLLCAPRRDLALGKAQEEAAVQTRLSSLLSAFLRVRECVSVTDASSDATRRIRNVLLPSPPATNIFHFFFLFPTAIDPVTDVSVETFAFPSLFFYNFSNPRSSALENHHDVT